MNTTLRKIIILILLCGVVFATHLGGVKLGKTNLPPTPPTAPPANENPTAYIDSIEPNPVDSGVTVQFGGHGTDDGAVEAYSWYSDLEGAQISTAANFDTANLLIGTHNIWFKVQDDDAAWSDSVTEELVVELASEITDSIGAEWYAALEISKGPIGGWFGYTDTFNLAMGHDDTIRVSHADTLEDKVEAASSGDRIYICDSVEIDLTDYYIVMPTGVQLVSGRGTRSGDTVSHGALIYVQDRENTEWEIIHTGDSCVVAGIRFRGSYSPLEGDISSSDTAKYGTTAEYAIQVQNDDSVEIHNCEFWGWGAASMYILKSHDIYIHHNYFHHQGRVYTGYGISFADTLTLKLEANYWNWGTDPMFGGGARNRKNYPEYCYNINRMGRHSILAFHSATDGYRSSANIHHNTLWKTSYAGVQGLIRYVNANSEPEDSIRISNNWCFVDSAVSWAVPSRTTIYDNQYGGTVPDGLAARIPTAVIGCDIDSGTIPLTVKVWGHGSSDPDGGIMQYHWNFSDSLTPTNYRHLDSTHSTDTVEYIYDDIGKYYIELEVVDNDGCRDWAYHTILAKPDDSNKYLSLWLNQYERFEGSDADDIYVQVLLEDGASVDTLLNETVGGWQNWTHFVFDVTDTLDEWACDSVDIVLRWYCGTTNSNISESYMFWDDVWLFGGNVVNWNFEDGYPKFGWTGTHQRTDGNWIPDEYSQAIGTYYCWDDDHIVHSGINAFNTAQMTWGGTLTQGDWGEVRQTVDVLGQ